MVGRKKERFAAGNDKETRFAQTAHAVGLMLTTLGIPCLYYGTEQAFDGSVAYHDENIEPRDADGNLHFEDRYIRETMFGGTFGPFETEGCHFFDPDHPTYLRIAAIARIRNRIDMIGMALRREGNMCGRRTFSVMVFLFQGQGSWSPGPGSWTARRFWWL